MLMAITSRTTQGNPLSEVEEYRVEVCILLRQLERLDKDEFTEDERADAEEVSNITKTKINIVYL